MNIKIGAGSTSAANKSFIRYGSGWVSIVSEIQIELARKFVISRFVALYSYNPSEMSPNTAQLKKVVWIWINALTSILSSNIIGWTCFPTTPAHQGNCQCYELLISNSIIKVHGDVGPDGYYWGEIRGKFGFVPSNTVIEIDKVVFAFVRSKLENFNTSHFITVRLSVWDPKWDLLPSPNIRCHVCRSRMQWTTC